MSHASSFQPEYATMEASRYVDSNLFVGLVNIYPLKKRTSFMGLPFTILSAIDARISTNIVN